MMQTLGKLGTHSIRKLAATDAAKQGAPPCGDPRKMESCRWTNRVEVLHQSGATWYCAECENGQRPGAYDQYRKRQTEGRTRTTADERTPHTKKERACTHTQSDSNQLNSSSACSIIRQRVPSTYRIYAILCGFSPQRERETKFRAAFRSKCDFPRRRYVHNSVNRYFCVSPNPA